MYDYITKERGVTMFCVSIPANIYVHKSEINGFISANFCWYVTVTKKQEESSNSIFFFRMSPACLFILLLKLPKNNSLYYSPNQAKLDHA